MGSVFWKLLWRQFAEFVSSLCVEGEAARTSHELGWKTRPRNLWLINKPSQRTRITMAKRVVRNLLSSPGHGQIFCKQFRRTKGLLSRKYQKNVGNWQYFSYLLLKKAYFQSIIIPFCEEYWALPRSTADQFRWIYRLKEPKIPGVLGIRQIKELLMSIISDIYRHGMEKFLLVTSLLWMTFHETKWFAVTDKYDIFFCLNSY